MNVSDRRVFYAPHDWSNSYVKSVERVKERFGRESGVFFGTGKYFKRIFLDGLNVFVNTFRLVPDNL